MMKIKIVHTVYDDKFIDGAISLFETDDRVSNTYVVFGERSECKYLHSRDIRFVDKADAVSFLDSFDVVIIHSLPTIPANVLGRIRNEIIVVWFAWGYDIYEPPYTIIPLNLYGPETSKLIKYTPLHNVIHFRSFYKKIIIKRCWKKDLSRINYFSGVFPYEIFMIKAIYPNFKALAVDFYYGAKDFFIPQEPNKDIIHGKKNILLGNSADMSGNHLDLLKKIAGCGYLEDEKIIIPLSYGGTDKYVNRVADEAERIAKGNVMILKDFLPLNEYINLISNCKSAFFGHERQQASDNIFMQLLYGARVFMSENSAAFTYLKSLGLKVYSIQNDIQLLTEEMKDQDVMINRNILSSLYCSTRLIERVKNINSILLGGLQ